MRKNDIAETLAKTRPNMSYSLNITNKWGVCSLAIPTLLSIPTCVPQPHDTS